MNKENNNFDEETRTINLESYLKRDKPQPQPPQPKPQFNEQQSQFQPRPQQQPQFQTRQTNSQFQQKVENIEITSDFNNNSNTETQFNQTISENNNQNNIPNNVQKVVKTNFVAYGGFWRRLASSLWDLWPAYIISILIFGYIAFDLTNSSVLSFDNSKYFILSLVIYGSFIVNIIYNIFLYYKYGVTIGYKMFGMKIVFEETDLMPVKLILFLRWFYKFLLISFLGSIVSLFLVLTGNIITALIINIIGFVLFLVTVLFIAFKKNKQALYDILAKTIVVSEKLKKTWLVWLTNIIILAIPIVAIVLGGILSLIDPQKHVDRAKEAHQQALNQQIELQKMIQENSDNLSEI